MKKKIYIIIMSLFSLTFLSSFHLFAQDMFTEEEALVFLRDHEPLINETLDSYNREDHNEFHKYFSQSRFGTTEKAFKTIWIDGYKDTFGSFVSKSLIHEKCSFNKVFPLLVYKGVFEKHDNVTIKISFIREDETEGYKIFYLRFDVL